MGKTQYSKCMEVLKSYPNDIISFDEIVRLIRTYIGNDKYRTLKPCFELMRETKLIEEVEHGKFRILCRQKIEAD